VDEQAKQEILALVEKAEGLEADDFAPRVVLPEGYFNSGAMPVGGRELTVRHIGAGHTDNDIFIFVKDANVLHTGDLVFNRLHPFFDESAEATSEGWMKSCRAMVELCDAETIVVPGHGAITDVEGIKGQIRYFEIVRESAGKAIDAGKSKDEFAESEIEALAGYGFERIKARTFGSVYDEIVRERG
jgi:glyoxylase-like metal-dependent hydrolase (beta-lactamase superfamily II)